MKICPRCGKETDQPFHTCLKMKTSQEEAEELAQQTALNVYHTRPTRIEKMDELLVRLKREVNQVIPLPELIAVARAANGLSMGSDWNNGTHAKEHGYRQQLIDALQALRATGKVEL